jgi:predicted DsbA family dithiol-disulfide isomerase
MALAPLHIDFVSDITCPWCAIGLHALEQAIARLGATRPVELNLQPFELNPDMPPEGEPIADYAARKYGASADEMVARQVLIRARGAEAGLALAERTHVYNTFDAHRLLHWAGLQGRALDLKRALLQAYHVRGENPAAHEVLLRAAAAAGLDAAPAREVLASGAYADAVRDAVRQWQQRGIESVPSVIIDGRYLIQGCHLAAVFEQALRRI